MKFKTKLTFNSQHLLSHTPVDCFIEWVLWSFSLYQLIIILLKLCFLSIMYIQPLVEVYKNCLLTVDWFAHLGFWWYLFRESKLHEHSIVFSSTFCYSLIFTSWWVYKKDYTINSNNSINFALGIFYEVRMFSYCRKRFCIFSVSSLFIA